MMARMRVGLALVGLVVMRGDLAEPPGALLRPGMQLIYTSNGEDQAPWVIDSVRANASLRPGSDCIILHQRRQPGQTTPEESRLCLANDTLFSWNRERSEWVPQRPVRPGMVMEFVRTNGSKVRYEVGGTGQERVPGLSVDRVPVVFTTVTTTDSLGRPRRRLTELYAIGLATATAGEFEVPDSLEADGWRTEQRFKLREIRTTP
jgi:hypothetical protein